MSESLAPYVGNIPSILKNVQVGAGKWNKYMRILVFGAAKSGKSYFLASMPKPILAASGGDEQGISQYLDPQQGDICFEITTPDQLLAFIQFGTKNMDQFKSIVFDPITPIWNDYMDHYSEKFGGEIKGGQWKTVKAPWALFMRQLKRSKSHVGMSAWVNDFYMEKEETMPGVEKTIVGTQEVPKVEKRIPHHVDIILQTSIQLDKKRKATSIHEIAIAGGRRPRTVSPKDFYTGRKWTFDDRQDTSPWDVIVEPIRAKWQDATGAVDFIGLADAQEATEETIETDQIAEDYQVGAMLRVIEGQTSLHEYSSKAWPEQIAPYINGLKDAKARARVEQAHETKKNQLKEAGK